MKLQKIKLVEVWGYETWEKREATICTCSIYTRHDIQTSKKNKAVIAKKKSITIILYPSSGKKKIIIFFVYFGKRAPLQLSSRMRAEKGRSKKKKIVCIDI